MLRAEIALEAGFVDEARAALDEARRLDPATLSVEEMQARLTARAASPVESASVESAPVESAPVEFATIERRHRWGVPAGAAALMALAAFAGWSVMRRPDAPPAAPVATAHRDVILPAPGVPGESAPSVMVKTELTRAEVDMQNLVGADLSPTAPAVLIDDQQTAAPVLRAAERPAESSLTPVDGLSTPPPEPVRSAPPPALPVTPLGSSNVPITSDVPVTVPAAAAPPAPTPSAAPAVDEVARVRSVLAQYESAYANLDAAAALAVWPGVDERALTRAFSGLQSQQMSLGRCDVAVKGAVARANCLGQTTWTPKVGSGRTEARQWNFTLQNAGGDWKIVSAQAR